jgi:hypothetical protein
MLLSYYHGKTTCQSMVGRDMGRSKTQVTYPRKKVLAVLQTLEEFVVSLDHIGSASYEMTSAEHAAALTDFIQRHKIFRKLAQARTILSEPFRGPVGADGMDELEREMQDVHYWKPRKKK